MSTYIPASLKEAHDRLETAQQEYYVAYEKAHPASWRIGVGSGTSSSTMLWRPLSQGTRVSMRRSLWSA